METYLTYFIIILFVIFVIYGAYVLFCQNKNAIERYQNMNNKIVVLLKTHTWNDHLEKFAMKIHNETSIEGIDFYILMHNENNNLINMIKNKELLKHILTFTESDIRSMYSNGFYGMWLSNHWILMWFYNKFRNKYQYFWSIEYDVRISGNTSKIWTYSGGEDFIFPIQPFKDPNWAYRNHYVGPMSHDEKYYGYLQLARYSNRFLNYLDRHFREGENGQDELIIFSLFMRGKFTGSKDFLNKYIDNSWSVFNTDSDKHKYLLEKHETESLRIYHPIK